LIDFSTLLLESCRLKVKVKVKVNVSLFTP